MTILETSSRSSTSRCWVIGVAFDGSQAASQRRVGCALALEDLHPADDGIQRGAELVREHGQKLVLQAVGRLCLLSRRLLATGGLARALFAVAQRLLLGPAFGHIAEHEHRAANLAVGGADGRAAVVHRPLDAVARDQQGVVGKSLHLALRQHARHGIREQVPVSAR